MFYDRRYEMQGGHANTTETLVNVAMIFHHGRGFPIFPFTKKKYNDSEII